MKTPVIEIRNLRLDKWGCQTNEKAEGNQLRLSIYFDYRKDNHHIQFPEGADRSTVVKALRSLADLISKGEPT